jgi:hypothetical protein
MKPGLHTFIVLAALAVSQWHSSVLMAQEARFTYGAAEGGQVVTNRDIITFSESSGSGGMWELPSSALTVQLLPGDSDLFVFEFDAECRLFNLGADILSVQARLNGAVGGILGGSYLQPQNNPTDLEVCNAIGWVVAVSKSWVIRLSNTTSSPQTYTFSIWVRVVDGDPDDDFASGQLDNRTVRITRYN